MGLRHGFIWSKATPIMWWIQIFEAPVPKSGLIQKNGGKPRFALI
jgi:hypothetical protein